MRNVHSVQINLRHSSILATVLTLSPIVHDAFPHALPLYQKRTVDTPALVFYEILVRQLVYLARSSMFITIKMPSALQAYQ